MSLAAKVSEIRERMALAAARSGRIAESVRLIAVSKYVDADVARQLADLGCFDLGEARPQELWRKAAELADLPIRWHLVGHLQTNKIRRTLPLVHLIHSIDSVKLLDALQVAASSLPAAQPVQVLIEVNTSGDQAKHGVMPEQVEPLLAQADNWPTVKVCGLMTMAALEGGLEIARRNFADLRQLTEKLRNRVPDCVSLNELSMGMSDDFEVAIEEGATLVRIGSALFDTPPQ